MVLFGCGVHGLGEVAHVARGDAGDGDSAVLGEVDAVVAGDGGHLLGGHPREGEHADLVRDVPPVPARACKHNTVQ